MESCAACGRADVSLKACKACKMVKYCGVDCQVAHRSKHKKACREKARELFDVKLFAQPPRREDCPICCLPMLFHSGYSECTYMQCCGKFVCRGCIVSLPRPVCPFCNTPASRSTEEDVKKLLDRIERFNDPEAINMLAGHYRFGRKGFNIDYSKAVELYRRACELGSAQAHHNLGNCYLNGDGVEMDKKKAAHHWQIAAMMGHEISRSNLGSFELERDNFDRAMKHHMIAAKCGFDKSLEAVKTGFGFGFVTKDEFESTLRAHKDSRDEMRSEQRDKAMAMKFGPHT